MTALYLDSDLSEAERRARLYAGDIFVFSPSEASLELAALARQLLEEAFAPHDPRLAQHHLTVDDFAAVLADVKPRFIHHPRCKELVPRMLAATGCDAGDTYFDVPRLRSSTSDEYLTTGISFAFHPHRDTWYSAAPCQLNWWLPVYPVEPGNGMTFYPGWFDRVVPNDSERFNYYEWNSARRVAPSMVGSDERFQPRHREPIDLGPELRVVAPVGGPMVFSAQQFHGTVENRSGVTRFSIDLRTVNRLDVESGTGAPTPDTRCQGTSLRDFLRSTDLSRLPDDLVARYDDVSAQQVGELVYQPSSGS